MMYTKEKEVNKLAEVKLEQFLEEMAQEALLTHDTDRELLLLSAYFVGCESLKKKTFMIIEDDELPQKHIIVPGIPFELSQAWAY